MSLTYSPKIATDGLLMCLDASNNKSYPTDLPVKNGLVMWMDAADDTTFSYSSGTTVSQWRDKSGFNYHMVPISAGPTRSSALNSRKVLAFTTAQSIGSLSFTVETSANTVFVVSRLTGATNARVLTAYYNNWLLGHWAGWVNAYYAEGWIAYNAGTADTVWRMYMGDWGGASNDVANAYSNGTLITNQTTSSASAGPKGLGINYQSTEPSACEAAEIIVFNRILSDTERKLVHTYLGQKWGISNTDRSIIDLAGNDDNGLFGNGTVANMPDYDFYNKGTLSFTQTSNDTILTPLPITSTPALSNFTYEIWTKLNRFPTAVSPANAYGLTYRVGFLFGAAYYSGAGLLWYGYAAGDAFSLYAFIRGADAYRSTNGYPFALNQYYHCVMVNNYGANKLQLYINGTLYHEVATATAEYYAENVAGAGNIGISKAQVDGGGTANYSHYDGIVAAARIYSRALSAAEVLQNYEAQKSKFANTIVQQGLMLHLDAENPSSYAGAGTVWYDVSGNGYNAGMNNITPSNWVTYNGVKAFETNDTNNQNFTVGSFPFPQSGRTYEIWINSKSFSIGWQSWFDDGNGERVLFGTSTNTMNVYPSVEVSANLAVGQWYQLLYTMVGGSGTAVVIYKDGQAIGSGTYGPVINSGTGILFILGDSGSEITSCYCSTVRVYNRVLSAAEVLQNYNATKGKFGL